MPRPRKLSSKERRAKLVKGFGMATLSKRQCQRCRSRQAVCRVNSETDPCLECIHAGVNCSLAPISLPRWKRLNEKRERLELDHNAAVAEAAEAVAKAARTRTEIKSIREEQDKMVKQELENIAVQEEEERAEASSKAPSDLPPFDVGELDFSGWDPLTAGFDSGTAPTPQGS